MEALKRCLRWIAPDAHNLDPHLKPQIDFFLHEGRVLPQLAYVGHVEQLQHDWPALVSWGLGFGLGLGLGVEQARPRRAEPEP